MMLISKSYNDKLEDMFNILDEILKDYQSTLEKIENDFTYLQYNSISDLDQCSDQILSKSCNQCVTNICGCQLQGDLENGIKFDSNFKQHINLGFSYRISRYKSKLETEDKAFICDFDQLLSRFIYQHEKYNIDKNSFKPMWQQIGFNDGIHLMFPANISLENGIWESLEDFDIQPKCQSDYQFFSNSPTELVQKDNFLNIEECRSQDPRLRPWFVSAVTGPKIVNILIDMSGSMRNSHNINYSEQTKIDAAIEATDVLLKTLTNIDKINIILQNANINIFQFEKDKCKESRIKFEYYDKINIDGELSFEEYQDFQNDFYPNNDSEQSFNDQKGNNDKISLNEAISALDLNSLCRQPDHSKHCFKIEIMLIGLDFEEFTKLINNNETGVSENTILDWFDLQKETDEFIHLEEQKLFCADHLEINIICTDFTDTSSFYLYGSEKVLDLDHFKTMANSLGIVTSSDYVDEFAAADADGDSTLNHDETQLAFNAKCGDQQEVVGFDEDVRNSAMEFIRNNNDPVGNSNYLDALKTSYDILERSKNNPFYPLDLDQYNVMFFSFSDGYFNRHSVDLIEQVDIMESKLNAQPIFMHYLLGEMFDQEIMQQLSCKQNGIFTHITDFQPVKVGQFIMQQQQIFVKYKKLDKIYQTSIYEDYITKKPIFSASIPIYRTQFTELNSPELLGVVAIDLDISNLISEQCIDDINNQISTKNIQNDVKLDFTNQKQLENLRDEFFCVNSETNEFRCQTIQDFQPNEPVCKFNSNLKDMCGQMFKNYSVKDIF